MVSPLQSLVAGVRAQPLPDVGDMLRQQALTNSSLETQALQRQGMQQQQSMQRQQMSNEQALGAARYINYLGKQLLAAPESQWPMILEPNLPQLQQIGYTPDILRNMTRDQVAAVVQQTEPLVAQQQGGFTAGQRERQDLLRDLESEDPRIRKSAEIALGLTQRAVGSAAQTITEQGTAQDVARTEEIISERKGLGSGRAATTTKAIDDGYSKVIKIQGNIRNIDRAISALDRGANTGAVQRFLPSVTAASRELDQIRNELGLDVVGSTTFGALSESELDLALDTALPTGLDEADLKDFLLRKKEAQAKLMEYFQEQIDFLDQGGTVPGFLRMMRERGAQDQGDPTPGQMPGQPASSGFKILSVE